MQQSDTFRKDGDEFSSLFSFLSKVNQAIQSFSPEEWVVAEVSAISYPSSGHVYIDLIEHNDQGQELAKAKVNLWKGRKASLLGKFEEETGEKLAVGMKVMLKVSATLHPQFGFALVVLNVNPSFTIGEAQRKLAKIRKDLIDTGVFDWNKRFDQPDEFTNVAVISPPEAAGLGDFKSHADILQEFGLCHFSYYHSRFQGNGVEDEIVSAMRTALLEGRREDGSYSYDALVIIRGGGASSDLAYLNEFKIANAVCRTPVPVIVGIGHERDSTILDEVACMSIHTPSKVIAHITSCVFNNAQAAARDWQFIQSSSTRIAEVAAQQIDSMIKAVKSGIEHASGLADTKADSWMEQIVSGVGSLTKRAGEQCDAAMESIKIDVASALDAAAKDAGELMATVIGLGPSQTLKRGFAIVRSDGKAVTRASGANDVKTMEIEFFDGKVAVERM